MPDVIVTDWNLGDGTGADVLDAARRDGRPRPRCVLVSGTALDELPARSRDCFFDAFLQKPLTASDLLRAVDPQSRIGPEAANTDLPIPVEIPVSKLSWDLAMLDERITTGEMREAASLAHRLAAGCAMAGCDGLARELGSLERACRSENGPLTVAGAWSRVRRAAAIELASGPAVQPA